MANRPEPAADAGPAPEPRWSFTHQAHARARIEAVWSLVGEAGRWKEWSFLTRSDLEREGDPAPDGVGAVRRFTALGVGSREEVLEWQPPRHLAYGLISGFPVREYRADVALAPADGGTTLTWSVRFNPKLPGTGAVMWVVVRFLIRGFARSACRYADRQLPAPN